MASVELIQDLFSAIEKHKTQAETLAGAIQSMWRVNMIQTEKCDVATTQELTHDVLEQCSYSAIVLLHTYGLPEAANMEDEDLSDILRWIDQHWKDGTIAVFIP